MSEFIKFLEALLTRDVDIMLEAKSKEKALLELRQTLLTRQSFKQFVI